MAKAFTCSEHGYQVADAYEAGGMSDCRECRAKLIEAREREVQDFVLDDLHEKYVVRSFKRIDDNAVEVIIAAGHRIVIDRDGMARFVDRGGMEVPTA